MEISNISSYNQNVSKYKLLSSTAGVGAIVTTKMGYYVLVSDVNKWKFVQLVERDIEECKENAGNLKDLQAKLVKYTHRHRGLTLLSDSRFITFLKHEDVMGLKKLVCLVEIPEMALSDYSNSPDWRSHPVHDILKELNGTTPPYSQSASYMIPATHFPKWFRGRKGDLKPYEEWLRAWNKKGFNSNAFAIPQDVKAPRFYGDLQNNIEKALRSGGGFSKDWRIAFEPLTQTRLMLICPEGHLSDIPWPKYLKWRLEKGSISSSGVVDFDKQNPCCSHPKLFWSESKSKSDGYGSVFIECRNCGAGRDGRKVSLKGINSLKVKCTKEQPWEIYPEGDKHAVPKEYTSCKEEMQVSLATGNSVYFANGFSSIYIPIHLTQKEDKVVYDAIEILEDRYENIKDILDDRKKIFDSKKEVLSEDLNLTTEQMQQVEELFLNPSKNATPVEDIYEYYRYEEFLCFTNRTKVYEKGIRFSTVEVPEVFQGLIQQVKKVEELCVTQVQIAFTRVQPRERIRGKDGVTFNVSGQPIYSKKKEDVQVLPANQIRGEGIFIELNAEAVDEWLEENEMKLKKHFGSLLTEEPDPEEQGGATKQRIHDNGARHFLLHTFSHMLMRELEFSCGYPTASLMERLYVSPKHERNEMLGVLIYTAEGSEGSMGGLVWQAEMENLTKLLEKGLERMFSCSSDPLCWEAEEQGTFGLNRAACFSCSLVSETACEEMNLGLDRRVLIDEEFGFFKDFV